MGGGRGRLWLQSSPPQRGWSDSSSSACCSCACGSVRRRGHRQGRRHRSIRPHGDWLGHQARPVDAAKAAMSYCCRPPTIRSSRQLLRCSLRREQWQAEASLRAIDDPMPMPVRWRLSSPTLMDHPAVIAPDGLTFSGSSDAIDQVADAFRALPRRRLVIVGGPGTGKTTLALQLLLELLSEAGTRRAGSGDPLSRRLGSSETVPQEWLAERLSRTIRSYAPSTGIVPGRYCVEDTSCRSSTAWTRSQPIVGST